MIRRTILVLAYAVAACTAMTLYAPLRLEARLERGPWRAPGVLPLFDREDEFILGGGDPDDWSYESEFLQLVSPGTVWKWLYERERGSWRIRCVLRDDVVALIGRDPASLEETTDLYEPGALGSHRVYEGRVQLQEREAICWPVLLAEWMAVFLAAFGLLWWLHLRDRRRAQAVAATSVTEP